MEDINILEYWKDRNKKNYQKKISNNDILQKNSIEIVDLLKQLDLIKSGELYFEIGCGCGRNLLYLLYENKNILLAGNDLIKEECYKYMGDDLKDKMAFYEKDTLTFMKKTTINPFMLISSDHLMHIEKGPVEEINVKICENWKPKYILLRETKEERIDYLPYKYVHNFDIYNNYYETIFTKTSDNDNSYFLKVYRRLQNAT